MDHRTVRAETTGGVRWIWLSRPDRLNAFDEKMGVDLLEALQDAERSTGTACLVLTGEGEAFCVGEDLGAGWDAPDSGRPALMGESLGREYNLIVQRIRRMDKPVVAAVDGVTAGIGLGLAMACDLRAASERATFCETFAGGGLAPDPGTGFWLPRALGLAKAMEAGAAGKPIGARAALNLGLVDRVFPDGVFTEEVTKIARRLAERRSETLATAKRSLNRAIVVGQDSVLEYELYLRALAENARESAGAAVGRREES